MNKAQVIKFWAALDENTSVSDVLDQLKNKKGFPSERTLVRYAQARSCFRITDPIEEVARKTGWSVAFVNSIYAWWQQWQGSIVENAADPSPLSGQEIRPMFDPRTHRSDLLQPFLDLAGIEPLTPRDYDLALWRSRPGVASWPIAKADMLRDSEGRITIVTWAEASTAWNPLREHMEGDLVWGLLEAWKTVMARDITLRFELLSSVIQIVERPEGKGGTGMRVENLDERGSLAEGLGHYYTYAIYDQNFSRALGFNYHPIDRLRFRLESPELVSLDGRNVIRSANETQRESAIDYLIAAQGDLDSLPGLAATVEGFRRAQALTGKLKREIERVRLTPAFPIGSSCSLCRPLLQL